ncbi:hypothetical protein B0H11DRAFT_1698514 [Mycena galericulata]|nr:hypothetical protein B0H11DRAFT_1698514 [Mycena galericulata]
MYRQFVANRINDGKNAFSMRHIGISDSFPGVEIDQSLGWFRSAYLFAKRVFGAQSLRANAWVAPMRQEVLEQYIKLNKALMQRSPKLTDLTMESFSEEVLALLRKRDPEHLYRWNFHREVTPTRILSLRAADGEFSKEMPETGTRVGVQALVRFDTEQSIEIYDKSGKALHIPAPTAEPQPPRLGSKTLHVVPAQRQRVTEYLVLDKPMYIPNSQWMFRARFVPTPGRTVAV